MLDQAPGFVVGILTGLITGLLTGLWVARISARRKLRDHVRQVTADYSRHWSPVPGEPNAQVLTGGHLTVRNNSEWPVTEIIVMSPDWLPRSHIPYLGPGREYVEQLPLELIQPVGPSEQSVSLQLQDVRGRLWRWTPTEGQLSPIPPRIPTHAHVAQWLDRRVPWLFRPFFRILPKRVQVWLWGYDPVG